MPNHFTSIAFPEVLRGGAWHTTNLERFKRILSDGFIEPKPKIPGVSDGEPFVRSLDGVSLFDFLGFDESTYNDKYPNSTWGTFVPCRPHWEEAIWIELDRLAIKDEFIDGRELLRRWKERGEFDRAIMPVIEAAHIGRVPRSAFRRVLKYSKHDQTFSIVNVE